MEPTINVIMPLIGVYTYTSVNQPSSTCRTVKPITVRIIHLRKYNGYKKYAQKNVLAYTIHAEILAKLANVSNPMCGNKSYIHFSLDVSIKQPTENSNKANAPSARCLKYSNHRPRKNNAVKNKKQINSQSIACFRSCNRSNCCYWKRNKSDVY